MLFIYTCEFSILPALSQTKDKYVYCHLLQYAILRHLFNRHIYTSKIQVYKNEFQETFDKWCLFIKPGEKKLQRISMHLHFAKPQNISIIVIFHSRSILFYNLIIYHKKNAVNRNQGRVLSLGRKISSQVVIIFTFKQCYVYCIRHRTFTI